MSYDILAFDPDAVTDEQFAAWWDEQSEWGENHSYDRIAVAAPALRDFYAELITMFPPMNGPDALPDARIDEDPELEARLTDYSIGTSLVYAAFAWSQAARARDVFLCLAESHGVAVALVSEDGRVVRPFVDRDPVRHSKARGWHWPW